jgi:uridine kinase
MALRVTAEEVFGYASRAIDPPLVAIDGLPCSGKSTLATSLEERFGFGCIYLDDFVLPESEWPSRDEPAFPFEYVRYDEFLGAIGSLAATGRCAYRPFDWASLSTSGTTKEVSTERPVIIEGVSALNDAICHLYGLIPAARISDVLSRLEPRGARGG